MASKSPQNDVERGLPTWLYFGGLLLIYAGERLVGNGTYRGISALGALLFVGSIVTRALKLGTTSGNRRQTESIMFSLTLVGAIGLVLYGLQSDLIHREPSPRLDGALAVLWPTLIAFSALPMIFVEMAWGSGTRAPIEIGRIRDASMTGVGVAGALVFAATFAYVSNERDAKFDLSYFRTTRPGESTRKIVQTLDAPIDVSIFYPPSSDVREEVRSYFEDLQKESPQLKVAMYDNAIDIAKAKELNVSGNGFVVISRAGRKETLKIGLELEEARNQLRNLDKEVQKRFLQVARPGRTVYVTVGHGERSFDPASDNDKRATLRDFREVLQSQSYAVRTLGLADGLGVDVPSDATVVAIIGPTQELLPEEIAALGRYLDRGGRLLVALDSDQRADPTQPGGPPVMAELLGQLGLKYDTTPLANDQIYAKKSFQQSDRGNIATAGYSSHPSVTSLSKAHAPMVLVNAGHLEEIKPRPANTTVDFTVRAHGQTFIDTNRNFVADPGEQRKTWELAAAVKRKIEPPKEESPKPDAAKKDDKKKDEKKKPSDEMRALVIADADVLTDGILGVQGNPYYVIDGMRWLGGDESITGEVSTEVDTPVVHTRKQDEVWFYTCIVVVPALVILAGYFMTRRRRMGARSSTPSQKEAA